MKKATRRVLPEEENPECHLFERPNSGHVASGTSSRSEAKSLRFRPERLRCFERRVHGVRSAFTRISPWRGESSLAQRFQHWDKRQIRAESRRDGPRLNETTSSPCEAM